MHAFKKSIRIIINIYHQIKWEANKHSPATRIMDNSSKTIHHQYPDPYKIYSSSYDNDFRVLGQHRT